MPRYRRFSFEFKRQVVLDFLEGRAELRGLARQHSLSRHLIRLWIQKYEAGQLNDEVVDAVRIAEYETKIAELERKVGQLTMEVDLLKKRAQLGRQPNDGSYSIASGPKPQLTTSPQPDPLKAGDNLLDKVSQLIEEGDHPESESVETSFADTLELVWQCHRDRPRRVNHRKRPRVAPERSLRASA